MPVTRDQGRVSLATEFAIASALLTGLVIFVFGPAFWWNERQQMEAYLKSSLVSEAEAEALWVGGLLHGVTDAIRSLSQNSMLATALVDSAGKETYLVPFLHGVRQIGGVPVGIVFTDFAGDTIATNGDADASADERAWLRQVMASARRQARLVDSPAGPMVLAAELLTYDRTDSPEGALLYRFALNGLSPAGNLRLGQMTKGEWDALAEVPVDAILAPLHLHIHLMRPPPSNLVGRDEAVVAFGLTALLAMAVVLVGGRLSGRRLTAGLRDLEALSRSVVANGISEARAEVHGCAEVASLSKSLNVMLDRLSELEAERERKAAEELAGSRRLTETLLTSVGEGICGIDGVGRVIFANPEALRLTGFTYGEVIGSDMHALTHHSRADGTVYPGRDCPILAAALTGHGAKVTDEVMWRKDGSRFDVEYTVSPLSDHHGSGAVVVFRDVTERRSFEAELQRSNAELERFAYVASHDLRAPLRTVTSFLSLLERRLGDKLETEEQDYIGFIKSGARHMDRMILDLLDYSRLGRHDAGSEGAVDLGEALAVALANLAGPIADSGAELALPPTLPTVRGNTSELVRLFQNLIANALKFIATGATPHVTVTCERQGRDWRLSVCDDGIGIPERELDRLFHLFHRAVGQTQYEGTGIGLASCKKIVERHGGRIWAESPGDGLGSTFRFTLPADPAAIPPPPPPTPPA
jgi:PAS domain S-box-containing protein